MNIINIALGVDTQQCSSIVLGRRGENEVTQVVVDFSSWAEEFGAGVITLLAMRSQDTSAYPVVLSLDGNTATWDVTSTDTAYKGSGRAEYIYTVGDQIAKSVVFNTVVMQDIGEPSETPPDPYEEWLERLTELGAETQANAQAAEQSAANAAQSAEDAAESAASIEDDVQQAEEAARQAQSAQTASEAARDDAQTAQASAGASATAALDSASSAAQSASGANVAATTASNAATQAEAAKTAAQAAQQSAADSADEAEQAAQQAHVEYEQLAEEVADQKSAFEAHEQYAEETYAKQDGTYEDLTAGNAYELLSDRGDTNQQPYLFRQTGGDSSAYNREQLKKIVGGTVAWNQFVAPQAISSTRTENGITFTNNGDGSVTINGVATARSSFSFMSTYTANGTLKQDHVYFLKACPLGGSRSTYYGGVAGLPTDLGGGGIWKYTYTFQNSSLRLDYYPDATFTNAIVKAQYIDLTQMFGTAIADYVYSLEQATDGAGVAFFRSLFPADYYDYNPGELMSVEGVSAHIMRDADNNIVGNYPLDDSLTLRGIPKLDSNNRLYYDGDEYEPNGAVTRRYGVVDLGALNWAYSDPILYTSMQRYDPLPKYQGNLLCLPYINRIVMLTNPTDMSIYMANSQEVPILRIADSRYTDAAAFKAAMSGVMLVYELATPTTETADPYRELQICDRDGTEEFVSTGIVPVGHETFYPVNVFDYIDRLTEPDADMIADSAIAANKYFSVGNRLFLSTSSIAAGAQIIPGTNCTETSLAAALNALNT